MSEKDYKAILDEAVRTTYHEEDDQVVVNSYQDVEPHLELCAAARREDAENRGAFGKRPEFHRIMAVPHNVIMEIAQRLGIPFGQIFDTENQRRIGRELKSQDYKRFRTTVDRLIG
ncbi:MAG: hypothetical protein WA804_15900 [Terriglobales bacterium]